MVSQPPFHEWLSAKLGTQKWCVASRLTERLRGKGYEQALSPVAYDIRRQQWIMQDPRYQAAAKLPADYPHREFLIDAAHHAVERGA